MPYFKVQNYRKRPREMVQWLTAVVAVTENLGSVSRHDMTAHSSL